MADPGNILIKAVAHVPQTFRLRLCEWVLATIMMLFGIVLAHSDITQVGKFFGTLFEQWPPSVLAAVTTSIGLIRFLALLINGLWRRSPWVRAAMAMVSAVFWAQIAFALIFSGIVGTGWRFILCSPWSSF